MSADEDSGDEKSAEEDSATRDEMRTVEMRRGQYHVCTFNFYFVRLVINLIHVT